VNHGKEKHATVQSDRVSSGSIDRLNLPSCGEEAFRKRLRKITALNLTAILVEQDSAEGLMDLPLLSLPFGEGDVPSRCFLGYASGLASRSGDSTSILVAVITHGAGMAIGAAATNTGLDGFVFREDNGTRYLDESRSQSENSVQPAQLAAASKA
ncbi:hypothetical protein FOL47_004049, partial [Perkinsus chesapeaki]